MFKTLRYLNLIKNLTHSTSSGQELEIGNFFNVTSYKLQVTRSKGFTLIELLIYTSILVVVLAFTGEYLYNIGQARLNNNARIEVAQNGQFIMNKLKSDLSQTSAVTTPSDSNPVDNLVIVSTGNHDVSYSLVGANIRRNYDNQIDSINSNQTQISNLSFQKITNTGGKETIQVKFRVTSVVQLSGGRNVVEDFQTTMARR